MGCVVPYIPVQFGSDLDSDSDQMRVQRRIPVIMSNRIDSDPVRLTTLTVI